MKKGWIEKSNDPRAEFANDICKLLVIANDGDIEKAVKAAEKFEEHLHENVRNIYELIRYTIPLLSLREYDDNQEEYNEFLEDSGYDTENARAYIVEKCKEFYCD